MSLVWNFVFFKEIAKAACFGTRWSIVVSNCEESSKFVESFFGPEGARPVRFVLRMNGFTCSGRIWDSTPWRSFCQSLCLLSFVLSVGA
jgi:hypothetical protein